ncbi:hypothetical protein Q4F19_07840 [Sphingomonas sp. BIUV-7]|uniref:Uncharacterized protein n=1 Tax=Sphingomonas natans TaxID=3063330 RepID=A0ABT8Y7L2_9SPHN|nr:hypothetical protein [Sphingomonas sp. BIUV-7]MDO6414291.1 hypothetical protein [Sphingomonas sp. BIUV-7]
MRLVLEEGDGDEIAGPWKGHEEVRIVAARLYEEGHPGKRWDDLTYGQQAPLISDAIAVLVEAWRHRRDDRLC